MGRQISTWGSRHMPVLCHVICFERILQNIPHVIGPQRHDSHRLRITAFKRHTGGNRAGYLTNSHLSYFDFLGRTCESQAGLEGNILLVNIFYDLWVGTVSTGM